MAKYRDALLAAYKPIPAQKNGDPWFFSYKSTASPIYFPRFGKQDRKHYILNPISFFFLSKEIADNWVEIRKVIGSSKISASQPIFDWTGDRALVPLNFNERSRRLADLSVANNVLVKSDVARFFHSVYTHALAWAVHGKAPAKKNRSLTLLGNRLDLFSRNAQDGQTIGIPVGPETSRILAELIGAGIDRRIAQEGNLKSTDCTRFVDDFAFGVSTREQAERRISSLRRIVHEFELELNEEKTGIEDVYQLDYSSWRQETRTLRPSFGGNQSAFERFFDQMNSLSRLRDGDNILRYAIKASRAVFVRARPWPSIEDFLLLSYRQNASVLPTVVEILVNRHRTSRDVNLNKIANFIGSNATRLSETEKHGELAWLLYLASQLAIKVKSSDLQRLFELNCPAPALHVCHLHSLGLLKGKIDRSTWNTSLDASGLSSEMWLYAYEASLKGWTGGGATKFITTSKEFAPLWVRNVSFFDIGANVPDVATSSRKDMFLGLKIKNALGQSVNFDFDDSEEEEEEEDTTWDEYSA